MGTLTPELLNSFTDFMINEIGSKALDGITYSFALNQDKAKTPDYREKDAYEAYLKIRKEATKCGFGVEELFRVYEVSNGYIFDLDLSIAKKITYQLSKAVNKTNNNSDPQAIARINNLIATSPDKRRKADMVGLAKFIKKSYDANQNTVEVALYSKSSTPQIMITAVGQKNEMLIIKYHAFAIRHWDIKTVNSHLLMPAGIKISAVEAYEILPQKQGVKFKLYIEPVQ